MATPMKSQQFTTLLDRWGIKWRAHSSGWATHNRNSKGDWGPVNGVMLHHTGSDEQKSMPAFLWGGNASLPGPLCHGGIDMAGVVILTGWGRCNHAGLGSSATLNKVISEDYKGIIKPGSASVDGNARFYGFEIMYSGSHAMTPAQMATSTLLSAAICHHHNWGHRSVIGHGEWQQGKWDPGISSGKMADMNSIRNVIEMKIRNGPPPIVKNGTHVIESGESLYSIARALLGDEKRWVEIVALNKKLFPLTLVPGSVIKIPKK